MNKPTTYVALLRGINVGGNSPVDMRKLRTCFEALDYRNVRTYINSGNVIFQSTDIKTRSLEVTIEQALATQFSQSIRVVVHSLEEMQGIVTHIPKGWAAPIAQKCNIIFLRYTIDDPEILKNFNPKPNIEELHYFPGVLFWSAKTSDLTKSNMLKVNRMPIYKDMTIRGLNTTRKVYELMCEAASKLAADTSQSETTSS